MGWSSKKQIRLKRWKLWNTNIELRFLQMFPFLLCACVSIVKPVDRRGKRRHRKLESKAAEFPWTVHRFINWDIRIVKLSMTCEIKSWKCVDSPDMIQMIFMICLDKKTTWPKICAKCNSIYSPKHPKTQWVAWEAAPLPIDGGLVHFCATAVGIPHRTALEQGSAVQLNWMIKPLQCRNESTKPEIIQKQTKHAS